MFVRVFVRVLIGLYMFASMCVYACVCVRLSKQVKAEGDVDGGEYGKRCREGIWEGENQRKREVE